MVGNPGISDSTRPLDRTRMECMLSLRERFNRIMQYQPVDRLPVMGYLSRTKSMASISGARRGCLATFRRTSTSALIEFATPRSRFTRSLLSNSTLFRRRKRSMCKSTGLAPPSGARSTRSPTRPRMQGGAWPGIDRATPRLVDRHMWGMGLVLACRLAML